MVRYEMHLVASTTCASTMAPGRTGVDAQGAGAALIERRRIGLELETGRDTGEKHPRALLAIDHAAVLADPPDAGVLRVDALLHVMLVDENARRRTARTTRTSSRRSSSISRSSMTL